MYKIVDETGTKWTLDDIEMSARTAELEDCKKRIGIQTAATKYLEGRLDAYKEHVSKQRTMLDKYHEMIADHEKTIDELRSTLDVKQKLADDCRSMSIDDENTIVSLRADVGDRATIIASQVEHIYGMQHKIESIETETAQLKHGNTSNRPTIASQSLKIVNLKEEVDILKARVWDAENINIKVSKLVDRTHPDWRSNAMKDIANVVGNLQVGTEIMKNGTATTLIDYGKKLDAYTNTIEDLKATIKTNTEVSHADMDRKDGWIKELRRERDEYKESIRLEQIDYHTQLKAVNQFHHKTIAGLKKDINELKADTIAGLKTKYATNLKELHDIDQKEIDRIEADTRKRETDLSLYQCACAANDRLIKKQYKTLIDFWNARNDLKQTVVEKDMALVDAREIIDKITLLRVNEVETRQGLEAELSTRKGDTEVLAKVARVVKSWDNPPSIVDMYKIRMLVEEYIDGDE